MNDNDQSSNKSMVLSAGHSLTAVRSDLIKRGLSLIPKDIKNVLVVDDDPNLPWIIKDGLEKYVELFQVMVVHDGQMAVEILEKHPISLVVTNINMPKFNGIALLAYIKENYPNIPVIIMTGMGSSEIENLSYDLGATYFLPKPFMLDDLAKIVITNLDKKPFNKPKSAKFWFSLGICYHRLGRLQEAVKAFKQAIEAYKQTIESEPDLIDAFNELGNVYGELGHYQEAIETFKQTIKLKSDDAEAHMGLGVIYLKSGNKRGALKEYKMLKLLNSYRSNHLLSLIRGNQSMGDMTGTELEQGREKSFKKTVEDIIKIFKKEKQQD